MTVLSYFSRASCKLTISF